MNKPHWVPTEDQFVVGSTAPPGREGEPVFEDFLPAPELRLIGDRLVERLFPATEPGDLPRIDYRWKRRGGSRGGMAIYGKCVKLSGAAQHYAGGAQFLVWLAADYCELADYDARQIDALVYHELCLPAGTEIVAGGLEAASRRWYSGELIEIRTASGYFLSGTPNHPVLTARGWVPLNLLQKGDHVISCRDPKRVMSRVYPNVDHVPARIEKIAESGGMKLLLVPEAAQDFDSDIPCHEINVVDANRLLLNRLNPAFRQPHTQFLFNERNTRLIALPRESSLNLGFVGMALPPPCRISFSSVDSSLCRLIWPLKAEALGLAMSAKRDIAFTETTEDAASRGTQLLADSMGGAASGITLDDIIHVKRRLFVGHVYNLQTQNNWYVANNIVTHNCHIEQFETWDRFKNLMIKYRTRSHDFEGFFGELEAYGAWDETWQHLENVMRQLPLPLGIEVSV